MPVSTLSPASEAPAVTSAVASILSAAQQAAARPILGTSEGRYIDYARNVRDCALPGAKFPLEGLTFGVEVECYVPNEWVSRNGVAVGSYNRPYAITTAGFPEAAWKIGTDGSLDTSPARHQGLEFKTIPLAGPQGVADLVKGIRALGANGAKAKVNPSCGLHIHVGIPDATQLDIVRRLIAMSARFERVLYATTGSTERENSNSYCVPIRDKVRPTLEKRRWSRRDLVMAQNGHPYDENGERVDEARGCAGSSKYSSVNFQPLLDGRGTVEFRLFAGTLNVAKILGHLACSLGIVQKALSNERSVHPDGWTPNIAQPAQSAAALFESWRSFQVSMGWIGTGREVYGWNNLPESLGAPSLHSVRRKLMEKVKQYSLKKFGTMGANAAEETADMEGE